MISLTLSKCSVLVVLVVGVSVCVVVVLTPSSRFLNIDGNEVTKVIGKTHEAKPNERVVHHSAFTAAPVDKPARAFRDRPNRRNTATADIASFPSDVMRIPADRPLAQVNDRAILLKDLVPLEPDAGEQAMTWEEYASRLNRAIEVELTFQTAATEALNLTPEQELQVEGVARRYEAKLQEDAKQGRWNSLTPAQAEFEQRLTSALLLQQNFVAAKAGVAPSSDPDVQARYEHERRELLSCLRATSRISIAAAY